MYSPLLLNAARAFALVSFSDGRLSHSEEARFARVAAAEKPLATARQADVRAAWLQAVKEVEASQSFGGPLVSIRSEVTAQEEKALMMRVAQAAVVADNRLEPQENVAIRSLAEALGLDPETY
jgi:tellurite resistance protein